MLLPQGGHGRHAPTVGPEAAATLLLGMAASEKAVDAPNAVIEYAQIVPVSERGEPVSIKNAFAGCETFGEALTAILRDPKLASEVDSVEVNRSWVGATIRYRNMKEQRYLPKGGNAGPNQAVVVVTLAGSLLAQIALDLEDDDDSGWTGKVDA